MSDATIAVVEGPKGKAEVVEVINPANTTTEYSVRFGSHIETYKTMGEAYITAKEKAGVER
jgi:hypothetical protein